MPQSPCLWHYGLLHECQCSGSAAIAYAILEERLSSLEFADLANLISSSVHNAPLHENQSNICSPQRHQRFLSMPLQCTSLERERSLPDSLAQVSIAWVASFRSACSEIIEEQHSDTATARESVAKLRWVRSTHPLRQEIWPATSSAPSEKALLQNFPCWFSLVHRMWVGREVYPLDVKFTHSRKEVK